jgi:hypothetical protein
MTTILNESKRWATFCPLNDFGVKFMLLSDPHSGQLSLLIYEYIYQAGGESCNRGYSIPMQSAKKVTIEDIMDNRSRTFRGSSGIPGPIKIFDVYFENESGTHDYFLKHQNRDLLCITRDQFDAEKELILKRNAE